jgi:hypothetical protein
MATRCCWPPERPLGKVERLGGQAHLLEQLHGALARLRLAHAQHGDGADGHVVQRVLVREQLEVLEHHAHALAHLARRALVGGQRHAVDQHAPAVDGLQRVGAAQQRRLARARGPDQAHHLALVDLHRHAVERHEAAVQLAHVVVHHHRRLARDLRSPFIIP